MSDPWDFLIGNGGGDTPATPAYSAPAQTYVSPDDPWAEVLNQGYNPPPEQQQPYYQAPQQEQQPPAYQPPPSDIWNALTGFVGGAAQASRDPNPVTNWITNTWDALTQPWQEPAKQNQSPWEAIGDTVGRGLNSVMGGFGAGLEPFGGGVDLAADSNIPVVSQLGQGVRTAWEQAVEPAANFYTDTIGEAAKGANQFLGDAWGDLTSGKAGNIGGDLVKDWQDSITKQPTIQLAYMATHPEAFDQMNAYRDQLIEQERQSLYSQGWRGAELDRRLQRTVEKTMNPVTMAEQASMQDFGQLPLPEQFALQFFDKLNPGLKIYGDAIHPFQAGAGMVAGGIGKGVGAAAEGLADATGTRPFFDRVGEAIEGPQKGYKLAQDEGSQLLRLFSDAEKATGDIETAREAVLLDDQSKFYYKNYGIQEKVAQEAIDWMSIVDQNAAEIAKAKPAEARGVDTETVPNTESQLARLDQDTSPGAEKTLFAEENPPEGTKYNQPQPTESPLKEYGYDPAKQAEPLPFERQVQSALDELVDKRVDEATEGKRITNTIEERPFREAAKAEVEPLREAIKTPEDLKNFREEYLPEKPDLATVVKTPDNFEQSFSKTFERRPVEIKDYHRAIGIPDRGAAHGEFVDAVTKSLGYKRGAFKFKEGSTVGNPKLRETKPLEQLGAAGALFRTLNKTMPYLSRSFLNKSGRAVRDSIGNIMKYAVEGFGRGDTDRFDVISKEHGTREMGRASAAADIDGKVKENAATTIYFLATNPLDELSSRLLNKASKGRIKDWNDFTEKAEASMKTYGYKREFLRLWDEAINERVKAGALDKAIGDRLKRGQLTEQFIADYIKGKLPKGASIEEAAKGVYNPNNFSDHLREKYEKMFGDQAGPIGAIINDELNHLSDRVKRYNDEVTAIYEKKLAELRKKPPKDLDEAGRQLADLNANYNKKITLNEVVPGHKLWEAMKQDIYTRLTTAHETAKVLEALDPTTQAAVKNQLDQSLRWADKQGNIVTAKRLLATRQNAREKEFQNYEANRPAPKEGTPPPKAAPNPNHDWAYKKPLLDQITAYSKLPKREQAGRIARAQVLGEFRGYKARDGKVLVRREEADGYHFRVSDPDLIRPGEEQVWPRKPQAEDLKFGAPGSESERVYQEIRKTGYSEKNTRASMAILDAAAHAWALEKGRDVEDYYKSLTFQKGDKVESGALKQIDKDEFIKKMAPPPAAQKEHLDLHLSDQTTAPRLGDTVIRGKTKAGEFIYGKLSPEDWLKRVTTYIGKMGSEDFRAARYWYEDVHKRFVGVFGEKDADRYMMAWLASQQRTEPSRGLMNVFRQEDVLDGAENVPSGLNTEAIKSILQEKLPDAGIAVKLFDFIDSALGKKTRTWMGNAPEGGKPVAIDVWASRDLGFLDSVVIEQIKKFDPLLADKLVKDQTVESPGGPFGPNKYQTEYGNRYYQGITDYLNSKNFDGGKWEPYQAQALAWVAMQRMFGAKAEGPNEVFDYNTRTLAAETFPGENTPLSRQFPSYNDTTLDKAFAIHSDIMDVAVKRAADVAGVRLVSRVDGAGGWKKEVNPSSTIQVLGSPERVADFAQMLGYGLQQQSVMWYRTMNSSSTKPALDFVYKSGPLKLNEFETLDKLWKRAIEIAPVLGERFGFTSLKTDDGYGFRMLLDSSDFAKNLKIIKPALEKALDELDSGQHKLEFEKTFLDGGEKTNDWSKNSDGQDYREALKRRPEVERQLDDYSRGVREAAQEAWERHAPEALREHGSPDQFIRQVKRAEEPALAQEGNQRVLGTTQVLKDGRYLVSLFENANASTLPHELAHVFRHYLDGGLLKAAEDWAGVTNGKWEVAHEEKFARAFEAYLRKGDAPTEALKSVFQSFREWLKKIYQTITGSAIDISREDFKKVKPVFDKMLGGDAEKAVTEKPVARPTTRLATPEEKAQAGSPVLKQEEAEPPTPTSDLEDYHQRIVIAPPAEKFPAYKGEGTVRPAATLQRMFRRWNDGGLMDENGNELSKPYTHAEKVQLMRDIAATDEYIRKTTGNTFKLDIDTMAPVRRSDGKSLEELRGGKAPAPIGEPRPQWETPQPPNDPEKVVEQVKKFFGKDSYKSFDQLEKEQGKEAVEHSMREIAQRLDFPDPTNLNIPTEKTGFETDQAHLALRELEKDARQRYYQAAEKRSELDQAQDERDRMAHDMRDDIYAAQAHARQEADRGAYDRLEGVYFDYRNKNVIDQMLGSMLPFNYWSRRNFAYLARYFAANPVQFAAILQFYKNVEQENKDAGGIAPWNMGNILMWKNPDGSRVQWNISSMFPFNPTGNSDTLLQFIDAGDEENQNDNKTTGPLALLFGQDRTYKGKITGRDKGAIPTFMTPNPIFNILTQTGLVNKWAKDAGLVTDGFFSPDPSDKRAQRMTVGLVSGRTAIRDIAARIGLTDWIRKQLEPTGIKLADLDLEGPIDQLFFGMNAGKPLTSVYNELTEMAQGDPQNQEKYLWALAKLKTGNWTPEALKALDVVESQDAWRRVASEAGFVAVVNNTPREQLNSALGKIYGDVKDSKGHYETTAVDPKTGYETKKFVPGDSQEFFKNNAGASLAFAKNKEPDKIVEDIGNTRTSTALADLNRAYFDEHKMDLRTYNAKLDDLKRGNPTFFKVNKDKDYQQAKGELPYLPGEKKLSQAEVDAKYAKIEQPQERAYAEWKDDMWRASGEGKYQELAAKAHDLYEAGRKKESYDLTHSTEYLKYKNARDALKNANPAFSDRYSKETNEKYPDSAASSGTSNTANTAGNAGSSGKSSTNTSRTTSSGSKSSASSTPFNAAQKRVYAQALAAGLSKTAAAAKARATQGGGSTTARATTTAPRAATPAVTKPASSTSQDWDAVAKKAYALALGDGHTKAYATAVANKMMSGESSSYRSKTTGAVASYGNTRNATTATKAPAATTTAKSPGVTPAKATAAPVASPAKTTIANANSSGYTNLVLPAATPVHHSSGGGGSSRQPKPAPIHPPGSPWKVPSPYSGSLNRFAHRRRY